MKARTDKAILKKYTSALMSNHKWKKLFSVMSGFMSGIAKIEYHFTHEEDTYYGNAPSIDQVWDDAIDDPVYGIGGPMDYKYIESIFIPFSYSYRQYDKGPLVKREQPVKEFTAALQKVGQFSLTETEDGIWVHGYKLT